MPWKEIWEIDFFKSENKTYFILAECEMLPEQNSPTKMPDFIKKMLLFTVPANDSRFNNRNLVDPDKVKKLLKSLI